MNITEYDGEYTHKQVNRSFLRKFIRKFYLYNIVHLNKGKAIDFGCGIGELLSLLPKGSIGLEINEATVKYCQNRNMNVSMYNPEKDNYKFVDFKKDKCDTFIMSHVLEHMENPKDVLLKIMDACKRLGIQRIIIVVPGYKGFLSDKTHKTFINMEYIKNNNLEGTKHFDLISVKYFPFNSSKIGEKLTHNETVFAYDVKE